MGIGAAILGGAAISGIGGVASGLIGSSAAKSAANTQYQATEDALAQQKATTQQVLGIEQPFVDVGKNAIPGLEGLLGITGGNSLTGGASINPDAMNTALSNTPGYQFALKQGLMATQNGYAAQGLATSGAAIKGAGQYAEGLASTNYQNILSNYYNTVSLGSNAASNFGAAALGGQAAANQLTVGAGQVLASGTIGGANALTGGINSAANAAGSALLPYTLSQGGLFGNSAAGLTPPSYITPGYSTNYQYPG